MKNKKWKKIRTLQLEQSTDIFKKNIFLEKSDSL